MRRLVLLLALAALACPATASAAPFGELPLTGLSGRSSCVAATGAPGELVRDAVSARGELLAPALVRVGLGGATPAGSVTVDTGDSGCPAVAATPDGTAVAAGTDQGRIVVASRPAGGAFGPAQTVASGGGVDHLTVAISPRGDALVAWREAIEPKSRIRYVLRPAGGSFGVPGVLTAGVPDPLRLSTGISVTGEAVAAWSTLLHTYHQLPLRQRVQAAVAPPGGAFGAPQTVADIAGNSAPSLAVGDDGRALLTLPDAGVLRLAERSPGGAFLAPVPLVRAHDPLATAVAVGADGRAAVAWNDVLDGSAGLLSRPRTGPFGAPIVLARGHALSPRVRMVDQLLIALVTDTSGAFDTGFAAVRVTPAGTTAAWFAPRTVHGLRSASVRTAVVPTAGGRVERSVVGGGLHDVQDLVTFPTADGNAGVAWLEPGVDRLRAALPGAPARADTLAPALQVLGSADSVVKNGDPLVLRVRCSAACDVRGQVHGADGQLSLDRAGRGRLRIQPRSLAIGSSRRRLVTVRLLYGAPGALHPQARTLRVRVRVTGVPRIHHIRSVRATRVTGDRIRVRWTTDVGGSESAFVVTGSATRGGQPLAVNLGEGRRRRFSLTLRHVRGIRFVAVSGLDPRDLGHPREVRVR